MTHSPATARSAALEESCAFAEDVVAGLTQSKRSIPPKYFYDAAGSALFDRICLLPEYYPTRTELGILAGCATEMAEQIGGHAEVIEFGAGSLTKVRHLFEGFAAGQAPLRYIPIDISGEHLHTSAQRLQAMFPHLSVQPLVADYTMPLTLPRCAAGVTRRVGFFPGSTIGNLHPIEARAFLQRANRVLQGGGLLIGVDLVKDPAKLHAAYNDAQGVTAAFNLNLLRRINSELNADFDLSGFVHHAFYDPVCRRVEMHLVSRRRQTACLQGRRFEFDEGDTIHTESSYKFTIAGFRELATNAGFRPGPVWLDKDRLFSVHWLHASGPLLPHETAPQDLGMEAPIPPPRLHAESRAQRPWLKRRTI